MDWGAFATIVGTGFTVIAVLYTFMRNFKIDIKEDLKELKEQVTDIDRRLCRIEGALSAKDCCILKDDRQVKKAE